MTLPLTLYQGLTFGLSPLAPFFFKRRLAKGKEVAERAEERFARNLPPRPDGTLIWMHGASLGESKLLRGLSSLMTADGDAFHTLFTSQTASSANVMGTDLPPRAIHQMAPIDTPAATARFISHWKPDLCIFAEGEIWPNLLLASSQSSSKTALINARMTEKSLKGWGRFSKTATKLFSGFDLILAADTQTAKGLSHFTQTQVRAIGNLKAALAARPATTHLQTKEADLKAFAADRKIILGASTHAGEEALLVAALAHLDTPTKLILAPRHTNRASEIETVVQATGKSYVRRSTGEEIGHDTDIIIADTFGEMDLWYSLANSIYLGGAAKTGIGGHSPLEALSFGHNVITGPYIDNFSETYEPLITNEWARIAKTPEEIAACITAMRPPDERALEAYFEAQKQPALETLAALRALLDEKTRT